MAKSAARRKAPRALGVALHSVLLALVVGGAARSAPVWAQDPRLLDARVTQESVADTICRPGYADTVAPSFDVAMAQKDRLLSTRGIDAEDGITYALDRHVPIVLGGSPDAQANFDLLPWGGHAGERRKSLLTVRLKRCVCAGRISLAEAQATIAGNWSRQYDQLTRMQCGSDIGDTTSASRDEGP
ncbi:hypothetical protein F4827_006879 [Paraburkholderia bannensis]|uniref:Uncharacterized protein n=1 Tax=Paraburkholderia bannensis TaxID=765414 RepID=A0A7W9U4S7_9BURK|nr:MULTISPECIES: hypothetical protein [Paraburkholderia]MBB3262004.1 hypothetical protein [Paraburkholderia sp. WP4_3_2]MBB6106999.1 hypothetical protein [Paraburkholderia bannensis]